MTSTFCQTYVASGTYARRCSFQSSSGTKRMHYAITRPLRSVRSAGEGNNRDVKPESDVKYNKKFGYSRKDVILIGAGLIGIGYALYYGLQAFGVEAAMAGNLTQLLIFIGLCVGWVGTYVFRVATKKMTYVSQLKDYEEAVMKKRLDEMTEQELERMLEETKNVKETQEKQ